MTINRWEIWLANLDPSFGTEAGKRRPVLVIQSDLLNPHHVSTAVLPITTNVVEEASLLRYNLDALATESGLTRSSDVLIDQIRTVDNRRFLRKLGEIRSVSAQQRIEEQLKTLLDLL
ncbi:MAG: type II toxin-antitoxin system PemK/MazF family toxin [Cytophagaceae bacterium]|nr:type II toxin-antitoxin system PemK/MazF family toxin [Cytophagaceae bacterium]